MKSSKITQIKAMEILDSRGIPTIKTTVFLESEAYASACVPSGASTGKYEAVELRDNNAQRYLGKGVLQAVENVNTEIAQAINGIAAERQEEIDKKMIELDGTPNKARLGANAILSVSLAVARAAAANAGMELYKYLGGSKARCLPVPMCNVINGGAHASNNLDIQEFMIIPVGAMNFTQGIKMCAEVFQHLKKILVSKKLSVAVGDEGGFAPDLKDSDAALELLSQAVEKAGYKNEIRFALDAAASEWAEKGGYRLPKADIFMEGPQLIEYWENLTSKYPVISIEDGAGEEDWELWKQLTQRLGKKLQLVGDDLFVTNASRLKKGIDNKAANSILIKPNQIGTLTETVKAIKKAKKANFTTIMSHRSGETEDAIIADLAVGLGADQIKTGSLSRSERVAKYNRLMEIEAQLGNKADYKGLKAFNF
ncbi:MAG: phosphopyruvate hydratase [Christensenellales bacterium]|jgi:enolase|nr:phosphopyruvate hydratase [Clostridiales bacterium]